MKTFMVGAMPALVAVPTHAALHATRYYGAEKKNPEVNEKAYEAALESIPDAREKHDPWNVMRTAAAANKSEIGISGIGV